MSTCMSTSRSNYTDMSIWKKHADHSITGHDILYVGLTSTCSTGCSAFPAGTIVTKTRFSKWGRGGGRGGWQGLKMVALHIDSCIHVSFHFGLKGAGLLRAKAPLFPSPLHGYTPLDFWSLQIEKFFMKFGLNFLSKSDFTYTFFFLHGKVKTYTCFVLYHPLLNWRQFLNQSIRC